MKRNSMVAALLFGAILFALTLLGAESALAHCDGMDGPVAKAAQKALETGNVNHVLIWVQKKDEAKIRKAFEQTLVAAFGSWGLGAAYSRSVLWRATRPIYRRCSA
ncbi:DUF6448 family protein [candidate division KSB1 bacterium]|nr:DUF6448 family protein [candidate division KSB1 bacterium]